MTTTITLTINPTRDSRAFAHRLKDLKQFETATYDRETKSWTIDLDRDIHFKVASNWPKYANMQPQDIARDMLKVGPDGRYTEISFTNKPTMCNDG